jgi:membrane-associated phospholipid phosphatase
MTFGPLFRRWCILFVATLLGVAICILWLDVPLARAFLSNADRMSGLGRGLGSAVLVFGEIVVVAILAIVRIAKGNLPAFAKAVFVACCASLSAFVANDYILKFIFGRLNPSDFFQGTTDRVFNFFQGTQLSSFPSGHMVMATAFAMVMFRLQPRTLPILVILLGLGATVLVVGDWHFLGDVVAGTFVGGTAGFVAGELWTEHVRDFARKSDPET